MRILKTCMIQAPGCHHRFDLGKRAKSQVSLPGFRQLRIHACENRLCQDRQPSGEIFDPSRFGRQ